mmetsp:Transcript_7904/g.16417  ORF Transcript_7904/g.16417 Transcript_7904/m.16417 type:complete len:276 (+) Transcript_7904:2073-2900(+)
MKDRYFIVINVNGLSPLWIVNVLNPNGRCRPYGNRSTVRVCVLAGDFNVLGYLQSRNWLHADHHVSAQFPGRATLEVGLVHGHVLALLGAFEWNPRIHQSPIVGKAATDQKGHRIGGPILSHIGYFLGKFPVAINGISWYICPQIRSGGHPVWMSRSHVADLNQGTGFWVSLAKQQEIKGIGLRQDHQIALQKSRTDCVGGLGKGSTPYGLAEFLRLFEVLVQPRGSVPVTGLLRQCCCGIALSVRFVSPRLGRLKGLVHVPNVDLVVAGKIIIR